MTIQDKIEVLKKAASDEQTLGLVLDKLFEVLHQEYITRLNQYHTDLQRFENRFGMSSQEFYHQFEAGKLGDDMDYFEWAGLFELEQRLLEKMRHLEPAP